MTPDEIERMIQLRMDYYKACPEIKRTPEVPRIWQAGYLAGFENYVLEKQRSQRLVEALECFVEVHEDQQDEQEGAPDYYWNAKQALKEWRGG